MIGALLAIGSLAFLVAGVLLGVVFANRFHHLANKKLDALIAAEKR